MVNIIGEHKWRINLFYICILLFVVVFMGCQKIIEVPLNNARPRLVVDGLITDKPGPYYIKISTSGDYYKLGETPRVEDAVVAISDSEGNKDILVPVSNQKGLYQTTTLQGVAGRTYYLKIQYNGQVYEATSYMHPIPAKSIVLSRIDYVEGDVFRKKGYYLYFDINLKKQNSDVSYWRVFVSKNDSLYNGPNDYLLGDDRFLKDKLKDLELPYNFEPRDTVHIEMHSLDQFHSDYYNQLQQLLFNDGGLFSPPPVNPSGNISNQALGLFRASSITSTQIIIP